MISMTAFGHCSYNDDDIRLHLNIKSVNSRYLEFSINLPVILQQYEPFIISEIKQKVKRGHIDVNVQIQSKYLNDVNNYLKNVKEINLLCKKNKIKTVLQLSDLIASVKNINLDSLLNEDINNDKIKNILGTCLNNSLTLLVEEKEREGLATYNDLVKSINVFSHSLDFISGYSEQIEETVTQNLTTKIKNYIEIEKMDTNTLLTEVGIMVNRLTINEEVQRLKTHVNHFKNLIDSPEPVGKRLDFLCQEMLREVNTIASKTQIIDVTLQIITLKDCLENIREQTRNIE